MTRRFEDAWAAWNGAGAVATGSWTGGALAALEFAGVRGEAVLCPSNTFMATPLAILAAGGRPVFVDCNRDDLCASLQDFEAKLDRHRPKAAFLVHIGGHVAFEVQEIAALCAAAGRLPDRGLRPRARRRVARPAPGDVGRRRGLLLLRDQDRLDGGGRRARLPARRRARVRARVSQLRQARPPRRGIELPHERVHRRAGARADRAHGGDRRRQERRRARAARSAASGPPRAARRHGLRPLQVHRLRCHRTLDRQGLRRAVPPHHGQRRRPAQQRLGRRASLVRAALLPAGDERSATHEGPRHRRGRLHRLARRRSAARHGHDAAQLRRARLPVPRPRRRRQRPGRPARPGGDPRRDPGLRRRRAPGRRGRRRRRGAPPGRSRGGQRPRDAQRPGGRAPRRRGARRVRQHDLGLRQRDRHRRRGPRRRAARPPLHGDQARGRDVLPLLRGALRPGLHRPALRHPVRPARATGRRHPDLRAQGAGRRAADDRRRGPAVAALRLRRGPGRRRGAQPGAARRRARLQPGGRAERQRARDRRHGPRPRRRRRHRPHARARRGLRAAPRSRARARRPSSAGAPPPRSTRACGATSTGTAATTRSARRRPRWRPDGCRDCCTGRGWRRTSSRRCSPG